MFISEKLFLQILYQVDLKAYKIYYLNIYQYFHHNHNLIYTIHHGISLKNLFHFHLIFVKKLVFTSEVLGHEILECGRLFGSIGQSVEFGN